MFLCHAKKTSCLQYEKLCTLWRSCDSVQWGTVLSSILSCRPFVFACLTEHLPLISGNGISWVPWAPIQPVPTRLTKAHACAPRLDSEDQARKTTSSTIVSHRTSQDLDLFETFARREGIPLAVTDENAWCDAQLPTPRSVKDLQEASISHYHQTLVDCSFIGTI